MDPRAKATRESVFKACDQLMASGQYPSARNIVAITRGSLSTIGPLRDEWAREFAAIYRDARFLKGIPRDVSELLTSLWESACSKSDQHHQAESKQLRTTIEQLHSALADAQATSASLEQRLQIADEASASLHAANRQLHERIASDTSAHQTAIQRFEESVRAASAEHAAKIDALQAQASEASARYAQEISQSAEERRRLMLQVDSSRQDLARLASASDSARAKHEAAVETLTARADQQSARADQVTSELADARAKLATLQTQLLSAQALAQSNAAHRDALAVQLLAKDNLLDSQSRQLDQQLESNRSLAESVQQLQKLLSIPMKEASKVNRSSPK